MAQFADELSSSPAASMNLPAAELGLQASERECRLSAMVAAKNQAIAELMLLDQPATSLLPVTELRLAAGAELTLKPLSELMLHSPAASVVLEAGAALTLEPSAVLELGRARAQEVVLAANQAAASKLIGFERLIEPVSALSGIAGLGLSFEPRATLASLVAEQYEWPMREFALAVDSFGRPAQEAAIKLVESMQPAWDAARLWRQTLTEQVGSLSRLAGLGDLDTVNKLYENEKYQIIGLSNVADQITGALQGWQAPTVHVTQVAKLIEVAPLTWLPERRPGSQPPPQNGNFGTPSAQPGQPVDWQQTLAHALRAGLATPENVVRWLLQQERGSQQPPQWECIELIALDYERNGHRYQNMTAFAAKHRLSRATVANYLKHYEAATGKQVRPGQGRAKRASRRQS